MDAVLRRRTPTAMADFELDRQSSHRSMAWWSAEMALPDDWMKSRDSVHVKEGTVSHVMQHFYPGPNPNIAIQD